MTTIISKDDFYISNDKRTNNLYTFFFYSNNESIIKSFIKTKIIIGASVSQDYKTLRLKACSIKTFQQFQEEQQKINGAKNLRISTVAILFSNLATQLKYLLVNHSESFIGFNLENIIVIDDNKFIYISNEHLSPVKKNEITITFPFSPNDFFLSPEQTKITEIPFSIHFKTAYYSLACLVLHLLTKEDECDNGEISLHEKWTIQLNKTFVEETRLHGLLKRCLVEEPKERSIVFI